MSSCREIELNGRKLRVYECGKIEMFYNSRLRELVGCIIKSSGYCHVQINKKQYYKHRVIGFAFLGLNIDDPTQQIDHIDRVRNNNAVSNLRIVTNQQNQFNTNFKGYSWNKKNKKWKANITVNSKHIHLGVFDNEEDARLAYIEAKEKYHVISSE
jgi:hypothetical protein